MIAWLKLTNWKEFERNWSWPVLNYDRWLSCRNWENSVQGCTNPWHQVAMATKFCTVAPNIFGSSVWHFLRVVLIASRILRNLLDFWNICAPLAQSASRSTFEFTGYKQKNFTFSASLLCAWFITHTNKILFCVVGGVRCTVFSVRRIVFLECILQAMGLLLVFVAPIVCPRTWYFIICSDQGDQWRHWPESVDLTHLANLAHFVILDPFLSSPWKFQ